MARRRLCVAVTDEGIVRLVVSLFEFGEPVENLTRVERSLLSLDLTLERAARSS